MVQLKNLRCCQASHIAGPHYHDNVLAARFSKQKIMTVQDVQRKDVDVDVQVWAEQRYDAV